MTHPVGGTNVDNGRPKALLIRQLTNSVLDKNKNITNEIWVMFSDQKNVNGPKIIKKLNMTKISNFYDNKIAGYIRVLTSVTERVNVCSKSFASSLKFNYITEIINFF